MTTYRPSDRRRTISALAVMAVHVVIGTVLFMGLAPQLVRVRDDTLAVFDVPPLLVPPPPAIMPARTREEASEAAPANLRATPMAVTAPRPILPPPPPPVTAAPVAADGIAAVAGAAPLPGPGTGAAGVGTGLGSGATGSGTGGGMGARLIRGAIVNRDYPRDARRAKLGGSVTVRFTVGTDGHAQGCSILRSSGVASLDETTCTLVEKRFRYAPARDAAGHAIPEERGWRQSWWLEGESTPPG